jgi:hypothetical protein
MENYETQHDKYDIAHSYKGRSVNETVGWGEQDVQFLENGHVPFSS